MTEPSWGYNADDASEWGQSSYQLPGQTDSAENFTGDSYDGDGTPADWDPSTAYANSGYGGSDPTLHAGSWAGYGWRQYQQGGSKKKKDSKRDRATKEHDSRQEGSTRTHESGLDVPVKGGWVPEIAPIEDDPEAAGLGGSSRKGGPERRGKGKGKRDSERHRVGAERHSQPSLGHDDSLGQPQPGLGHYGDSLSQSGYERETRYGPDTVHGAGAWALSGGSDLPTVDYTTPHSTALATSDPWEWGETVEEDTAREDSLDVITDFGQSMYDEAWESEDGQSDAARELDEVVRRASTLKIGATASGTWTLPTHGQASLQDTLTSALVQTTEEKMGFFPWGLLGKVVTEDRVRDELAQCLDDRYEDVIQGYARTICENEVFPSSSDGEPGRRCFRKIFVILVVLDKTACIVKFLEEGINDFDLPFVKVNPPKQKGNFNLRISRDQDRMLRCFKGWSQSQLRNFEAWQWTTLSPLFSSVKQGNISYYPLPEQAILPFTKGGHRDEAKVSHGLEQESGRGRLFKANIHPDHHNFFHGEKKHESFAVRRLPSSDEEVFKKEAEARRRLSNRHQHMVPLLVTYKQSDSYFLVFPWADTDLKRFWLEAPGPKMDFLTTMWVAEQCKGLVNGLSMLHKPPKEVFAGKLAPGYHGDIKPENVLWFPDPENPGGNLKLSDFGQVTPYMSNSSRPYRAPEWDIDDDERLGSAYDIWSLGCVFLEFITWLLGGRRLLQTFEKRRQSIDPKWYNMATDTFFELARDDYTDEVYATLKPAVSSFIKELHSHQNCSPFLHDFLAYISTHMLVFNSSDKAYHGRSTSWAIDNELGRLLGRCRVDEDYACPRRHSGRWF